MSSGSKQQGPGTDEKALADISTEAFARQQQLYNPMIDKYSKIAKDTAATRQRLAGSGNVTTQQAFSAAEPKAVSGALSRGGSVGSSLSSLNASKAQSLAESQAGIVGQAKDVSSGQLGQLIGFGRGEATQAAGGLGQAAEVQTQQAMRDAALASNERSQLASAGLGAAGLGYGLYKGMKQPSGVADPTAQNQGSGGNWAGFDFSGNTAYGG